MTHPVPDQHPPAVQRWPHLVKLARGPVFDRWQCVAAFVPDAAGGRARRVRNAYGTAFWKRMVREAPALINDVDDRPRMGRAMPCARIRCRVDNAKHLNAVRNLIHALEASGIEPSAVATDCRHIIGSRLASRPALTEFAVHPSAVRHARGALQ